MEPLIDMSRWQNFTNADTWRVLSDQLEERGDGVGAARARAVAAYVHSGEARREWDEAIREQQRQDWERQCARQREAHRQAQARYRLRVKARKQAEAQGTV